MQNTDSDWCCYGLINYFTEHGNKVSMQYVHAVLGDAH